MSKTIGANLKTHMAGNLTTLATCWKLARPDGQEYFFTNHNVDIVYDGDTYEASSGTIGTTQSQNAELAVDNSEMLAFLESAKIDEADIIAGLYDESTIDVFILNYESVADGVLYLAQGWTLGQVTIHDNHFEAEVRGLAQHLQQHIGDLYSPTCRADLGDTKCSVDLTSSATEFPDTVGVVDYIDDDRRIFTSSSLVNPESEVGSSDSYGVHTFGKLTWTTPGSGDSYTGANAGLGAEVKDHDRDAGTVELFAAMPYDIEVGDAFSVTYGCDKTPTLCRDRFSNFVNFRGEPFIPGPDRVLDIATHLGGSIKASRRGSIRPS